MLLYGPRGKRFLMNPCKRQIARYRYSKSEEHSEGGGTDLLESGFAGHALDADLNMCQFPLLLNCRRALPTETKEWNVSKQKWNLC